MSVKGCGRVFTDSLSLQVLCWENNKVVRTIDQQGSGSLESAVNWKEGSPRLSLDQLTSHVTLGKSIGFSFLNKRMEARGPAPKVNSLHFSFILNTMNKEETFKAFEHYDQGDVSEK